MIKKNDWISFKKAKIWARKSGIKTGTEWKKIGKLKKLPKNVPNRPDHVYKNVGWISWADFLGTNNLSGTVKSLMWVTYDVAEKFVWEK